MTKEQLFFIQILSDHLNGRNTEPATDVHWEELSRIAQSHQVNGMVYQQCRSFLPAEWNQYFGGKHAAELYYYVNRVSLFNQVQQKLSADDIPFFTVKGLDVAKLYPVPALRTMGDCDIVVHSEDKESAHEVMTALGFQNKQKNVLEWMYYKNGFEFEIHDHLLYDEPGIDRMSLESVDRAWDYAQPTGSGSRYALDWSYHYLFLLLHLKKHLIHSGVGFRQFMDLHVVMERCELDWTWLRKTMEALNLLSFASICFVYMNRWFGTPLPFSCADIGDDRFEEATEKIFSNGIFGFDNEENRENRAFNVIAKTGGPRWLLRLRNLVRSAFPSYTSMRYASSYSFLDGRPWLLPAAWIYRFYRAIRYRHLDKGQRMIDISLISNEKLDERQQELAKWGL